ncbi:hypothetical protein CORC01_07430 [Colletotrichum orchidophilum]|uniref:Ankyrin repeat-containing protein n=1 Tax=Colletotrichum orchidophilum TaxID=1209926 RepID=A0A1G4B763_9PEZI|nr:uncharacterized protein CORC01_07430 [Colletotrichum orchidophilum]OHE97176.1 hypothetical protein CORC01_07430 [Colletotrichum orchidophilum]
MLFTLLITMLLNPFRPCEGSPTFQEEYRGNYTPTFVDAWSGPQIVAPNTPYVAAVGRNQLYFLDTRFDPEIAKHIKEQIERATIVGPEDVIDIDEISATAKVRNAVTNETLFVFDPPYARVLFARGINKRNPDLKLPEHEPAGDWLVTYDIGNSLTKRADSCYDYGCSTPADCRRQTNGNCDVCHNYRVDNECDRALTNAIGVCRPLCSKAVDVPKEDGEEDTSYYQRMDNLHWK